MSCEAKRSRDIRHRRVASARPKALPMAKGQTIGKLRLPLPPADYARGDRKGLFRRKT
jgi:hypothetical protein